MNLELFKSHMQNGTGGKVLSDATIKNHLICLNFFFRNFPEFNFENVKEFLLSIPPDKIKMRIQFRMILIYYAKLYHPNLVDRINSDLRFRSHLPIERSVITEEQLIEVLAFVQKNLKMHVIVATLAMTGIRISELCNLTEKHIDFDNRVLSVRFGKGNKHRKVPIIPELLKLLLLWQLTRPKHLETFFGLGVRKIQRYLKEEVSDSLGYRVTPHTLRRAFVTINHSKGLPLDMLKVLCGHAKVTTTMQYCLTSEADAINRFIELYN